MSNIQRLLWHMGIGNRLKGYKMIILAVELGVEDEDRLLCVREHLYKPIARKLGCDMHCVERNIRTAINHAWRNNPDYLSSLAGFQLTQPPTVTHFLDMLVTVCLREQGPTSA